METIIDNNNTSLVAINIYYETLGNAINTKNEFTHSHTVV